MEPGSLALAAGVNVRTVQRIEEGQPGAIESVGAIARAFGVDLPKLQQLRDNLDTLNRLEFFPAVRKAPALLRIVQGAHAAVHDFHADDQAIRGAAYALAASAGDWNDIGLDAETMPEAERNVGELLQELEAAGGRLFCFRRPWPSGVKDPKGQDIMFDTVFFVVYPRDCPAIQVSESGDERLVAMLDPADKEPPRTA